MTTEELRALEAKVQIADYEEFGDCSVLILKYKKKTIYIRSDAPMEIEIELEQ